jgi:hypothetical protein
MKELFQKQKQFLSIYIAWFFLNLVCLFVGFSSSSDSYRDEFWPFGESSSATLSRSYDLSEFIVYAFGPLVVWFVYNNFKKD